MELDKLLSPPRTNFQTFWEPLGKTVLMGNPKSLNFYFLVIWWGKVVDVQVFNNYFWWLAVFVSSVGFCRGFRRANPIRAFESTVQRQHRGCLASEHVMLYGILNIPDTQRMGHVSTSAVHWVFEYASKKRPVNTFCLFVVIFYGLYHGKITIKPPFGMIFVTFFQAFTYLFFVGSRGFVLGRGRDLRRDGKFGISEPPKSRDSSENLEFHLSKAAPWNCHKLKMLFKKDVPLEVILTDGQWLNGLNFWGWRIFSRENKPFKLFVSGSIGWVII